jgi:hypothetical protein
MRQTSGSMHEGRGQAIREGFGIPKGASSGRSPVPPADDIWAPEKRFLGQLEVRMY